MSKAPVISAKILSFPLIQFCFKAGPIEGIECENVHSETSSGGSLLVYRVTRV